MSYMYIYVRYDPALVRRDSWLPRTLQDQKFVSLSKDLCQLAPQKSVWGARLKSPTAKLNVETRHIFRYTGQHEVGRLTSWLPPLRANRSASSKLTRLVQLTKLVRPLTVMRGSPDSERCVRPPACAEAANKARSDTSLELSIRRDVHDVPDRLAACIAARNHDHSEQEERKRSNDPHLVDLADQGKQRTANPESCVNPNTSSKDAFQSLSIVNSQQNLQ